MQNDRKQINWHSPNGGQFNRGDFGKIPDSTSFGLKQQISILSYVETKHSIKYTR